MGQIHWRIFLGLQRRQALHKATFSLELIHWRTCLRVQRGQTLNKAIFLVELKHGYIPERSETCPKYGCLCMELIHWRTCLVVQGDRP
jgi:hypothetical protein